MSIFAARLKELRATQSQAAFASAIGVNRVQYAKYESGQNTPSVEFLANVCRAMPGVSADWLLGLRDSAALREPSAVIASGKNAVAVGHGSTVSLGDSPACAKCPYKKKLKKLEAMIAH